jgi:hypothetical protein
MNLSHFGLLTCLFEVEIENRITVLTKIIGVQRYFSIHSRTLTGAKAHHTCLPTATPVHLDRDRPKEVAAAPTKVEEAPTEGKEGGVNCHK